MKITLKSLKEKGACLNGIDWFKENFGGKADIEEIIQGLRDIKDTEGWMILLFRKYKLSGVCEKWFENGRIHMRANYKDGKLHGLFEDWWKKDQLWIKENYKNGKYMAFVNGIIFMTDYLDVEKLIKMEN